MATSIQLRRIPQASKANAGALDDVAAAGEPIVVFADASTPTFTPRLYIGNGDDALNALRALGGPNSIACDQVKGLHGLTPNGDHFAPSGDANRIISLDANGTASLTTLNTQNLSGNTNLTMSGDLTIGDIDISNADHDNNGIIADDAGIVKIQSAGDTSTDPVIEIYQGGGNGTTNKTFVLKADGDITGVKNLTTTGTVTVADDKLTIGSTLVTVTGAEINQLASIGGSTVATQLGLKAAIDSQAFTGTPSLPTGTTAVTQSVSNDSTKLATTKFVHDYAEAQDFGKISVIEFNVSPTMQTLSSNTTTKIGVGTVSGLSSCDLALVIIADGDKQGLSALFNPTTNFIGIKNARSNQSPTARNDSVNVNCTNGTYTNFTQAQTDFNTGTAGISRSDAQEGDGVTKFHILGITIR